MRSPDTVSPTMTDRHADELSDVALSVIVRTHDHGPMEMVDTLLSLAAQESEEFEIVVEADSRSRAPGYRELISVFDPDFTRRVRLVVVNDESDETPFMTLVLACRGRYITRIDAPDVVFGNRSALFSEGINSNGGVLYGVVAEQPFATVPSGTGDAYVSVGRPSCPRPPSFDVLAHFETGNESPGMLGVAIPRRSSPKTSNCPAFQTSWWSQQPYYSPRCSTASSIGAVTYLAAGWRLPRVMGCQLPEPPGTEPARLSLPRSTARPCMCPARSSAGCKN